MRISSKLVALKFYLKGAATGRTWAASKTMAKSQKEGRPIRPDVVDGMVDWGGIYHRMDAKGQVRNIYADMLKFPEPQATPKPKQPTPKPNAAAAQQAFDTDALLAQSLAVPGLDAYVIKPKNVAKVDWHPKLRLSIFAEATDAQHNLKQLPGNDMYAALGKLIRNGFKPERVRISQKKLEAFGADGTAWQYSKPSPKK